WHEPCFTARSMPKVTCNLKCKFRIVVYIMQTRALAIHWIVWGYMVK
ncbi:hypothetical protein SAMN05216578_1282, partial [Halopseudomonas formosensis]